MFVVPKFQQLLVVSLLGCLVVGVSDAVAQGRPKQLPGNPATDWPAPPPNETREQMLARLGLTSDPGADPDETIVYNRFGRDYYIKKYERKHANFDDQRPGWVRPWGWVNATREIYQISDEYIWVFEPLPAKPAASTGGTVAAPKPKRPLSPERRADAIRDLNRIRPDFEPLTPAHSGVTLRFKESSHGLPQAGSWRNSLAVADMNEDGRLDLILPSQRGGGATIPSIFLGDGAGNWKEWEQASWPMMMNYGSVDAADFNKDGHMDLLFGMHLSSVAVLLGDGKGTFTNASPKVAFGTRKALARDVDHDGDVDIVAISEGPNVGEITGSRGERVSNDDSNLRVWLNDGKATKWTEVRVAPPFYQVGGDWLVVGDFTGDKKLDIAGSSIYYSGPDLMYIANKNTKERRWTPFGRGWMPFYSYYGALTAGHFTAKNRDDVIFTYSRSWPQRVAEGLVEHPQQRSMVGLERVSWTAAGPQRYPIIRWPGSKGIWGIASADFNGDGHLDVMYSRALPRAYEFLLGDGKGGFKLASFEGIEVPPNTAYDIKTADVNGDGRPDVILMYEAMSSLASNEKVHGSVKVYLNQGATKSETGVVTEGR